MTKLIEQQIKTLSFQGLYLLYKDVESRIGSYVLDGNSNNEYVQKQRYIASLIQDELINRSEKD